MPASASSLSALLPASATVPGPLSAADSIGLVQALTAVPDPRRRRGRRHGLQSGLLLPLQAGVRGSKAADRQPTKLVCVYDHAHQLVLTQVAVPGGDEVAAFALALAALPEL